VWLFFRNFGNPFVALLSTLSLISFLVADVKAGSLILVIVIISVLLRFIQEFRSTRTMNRLRARVSTTVAVSRINDAGERQHREIPLQEVVPGDIVHLSAGDTVPADVRLLSTRDLFVEYSGGGLSDSGAEAYVPFEERNVHVLFDGVARAPFDAIRNAPIAPRGVSFRWSPFPDAPQRIELSYEDGNVTYVGLVAWFEDGVCEDRNVAPECLE